MSLVVFALIALMIILAVYAFSPRRRISPRGELLESSGVHDEHSRKALSLLESTPADLRTPTENFLRGDIYSLNIIGGEELPRRSTQRRVAATRAAEGYLDTITQLALQPDIAFHADDDLDINFMLHRMEDFVIREGDDVPAVRRLAVNLDTAGPAIRANVLQARQVEAVAQAETPREAVENVIQSAIKYTDDPQNVHDSKVNRDLNATYRILRADEAAPRIEPTAAITSARKYIEHLRDGEKRRKALQTLERIAEGNYISTYNDTEDNIFAEVWRRSIHPRNRDSADDIKMMIVESLADAVENDGVVCINGRCSRMLNSLAGVDFNPKVGMAMTYEAYKNQIFESARRIIDNEITRARSADDADLRAIGESYEDPSVEVDDTVAEHFRADIRRKLDAMVDSYMEDGKLAPDEAQKIKEECHAAVI